jgi:hypothetical protein
MQIFNDKVMSRSILIELSSRMGEWSEPKHYVRGYDPSHTLQGARSTSEDDGRRRFEVAKERGYICECFTALEEIFASKSRPENKALILREFYQFSVKFKETPGQLFKRFYDKVYESKLAGVEIEVSHQIVIMLEALAAYPDLTERIIQIKEEIEGGMGVSSISQLEESINDYLRIKKGSKVSQTKTADLKAHQALSGTCHGCGKKGHYLRDCPLSKKKLVSQSNRKDYKQDLPRREGHVHHEEQKQPDKNKKPPEKKKGWMSGKLGKGKTR